jgi:hypothetical protein
VVKPRSISELAARAEQVLLPVVRSGSDPVSYGWLAERITETGEPGVGYFVPELADAAAIRAQTHRRVVSGVYDSGE